MFNIYHIILFNMSKEMYSKFSYGIDFLKIPAIQSLILKHTDEYYSCEYMSDFYINNVENKLVYVIYRMHYHSNKYLHPLPYFKYAVSLYNELETINLPEPYNGYSTVTVVSMPFIPEIYNFIDNLTLLEKLELLSVLDFIVNKFEFVAFKTYDDPLNMHKTPIFIYVKSINRDNTKSDVEYVRSLIKCMSTQKPVLCNIDFHPMAY